MNKVSYLERTDGKLMLLEISESLRNRKSKRRNCSSVGRCDFHFFSFVNRWNVGMERWM